MHINNLQKFGLALAVVVFAASCSLSTSMDATIEREVEATIDLKEKAKIPENRLQPTWSGSKTTSGSATPAKSNMTANRFPLIWKPRTALRSSPTGRLRCMKSAT